METRRSDYSTQLVLYERESKGKSRGERRAKGTKMEMSRNGENTVSDGTEIIPNEGTTEGWRRERTREWRRAQGEHRKKANRGESREWVRTERREPENGRGGIRRREQKY